MCSMRVPCHLPCMILLSGASYKGAIRTLYFLLKREGLIVGLCKVAQTAASMYPSYLNSCRIHRSQLGTQQSVC